MKTKTAWKIAQQVSLKGADNWGKGWTSEELELVVGCLDLPVAEVADALGRTVYAVSTVRGLLEAGVKVGSDRKPAKQEVGYDFITTFPLGWND